MQDLRIELATAIAKGDIEAAEAALEMLGHYSDKWSDARLKRRRKAHPIAMQCMDIAIPLPCTGGDSGIRCWPGGYDGYEAWLREESAEGVAA